MNGAARALFFCGFVVTVAAVAELAITGIAINTVETAKWEHFLYSSEQLLGVGASALVIGFILLALAWISPRE